MPANFFPGAFKFNFVVLLIALSCLSLSAFASKKDKVQGSKIIDVTSLITSTAGSYEEVVVVEKPKRSLLQHGHYAPALNHYGGSASKYQFFGGLNLNHYLSPAAPVYPTIHSGHGHGHSSNSYAPAHVPTYVPTPTYSSHSAGHGHSHGHGDSYGNGNGHSNSGGHGHVMTSHPHSSSGYGHGNGHGHSANNNYRSFGSTAHFHHNPSYLEEVYKLAEKAVTASHASQAISAHKHHVHQHSGSGRDGYGTGQSHNNNYAGPVPNHNSHHMGAGSGYGHGNRGGHGHGHGHGHGRGHSAGGAAHHAPLGHMDSYTVNNAGHSHSNSYSY